MSKGLGNFVGAFADGAILFPIIAALSLRNGFSATTLIATAGAAYIIAGIIFRVPISIQPLKATAIAAIAFGASVVEIQISTALLGAICLFISLFHINDYIKNIPRSLIHGLQLALGIILISQGLGLGAEGNILAYAILIAAVIIYLNFRFSFPLLGIIATIGLVYAIFFHPLTPTLPSLATGQESSEIKPLLILSLLLPQIILTLSNSVVGTYDVAERYFGKRSARVTPNNLLRSIGFGNLIFASIGGLPFCHGSGGVTAHVRGGSTHFISNLIIGFTLLGLALFQFLTKSFTLNYPPILLSSMLVATGFFHFQLAAPTWETAKERPRLVLMGIAAVLTSSMIWVLILGLLPEITQLLKRRVAHDTL